MLRKHDSIQPLFHFSGFFRALAVAVSAGLASAQVAPPLADATLVLQAATPAPLGYMEKKVDPRFGLAVQRVTDTTELGIRGPVPTYSQLQAWSADQAHILLRTLDILDAKTFKKVHKIDFGWPGTGNGVRWSPVEPGVLYYTGGMESGGSGDAFAASCPAGQARFMRYRLAAGSAVTGKRELVSCFPEYTAFNRDASFEELSDDGRYVVLVGRRADGIHEVFAYDITENKKKGVLVLRDNGGAPIGLDWAGISPSGKYVVVLYGRGFERYRGVEAYDRETMAYAGKVTTSSGHGDLAMDAQGNEYYVYTNGNNAYFLTAAHYIVKSRIPNGVSYDNAGSISPQLTVSSGASTALLTLDWGHGVHVSCRGIRSSSHGCVVSTVAGKENGWQPFEREVFYVDLESRHTVPKVERLAQHYSDTELAASVPDALCPLSSYWSQPHATISPDGGQVFYGSSWGHGCMVEGFIVDLSPIRKPGNPVRPGTKPSSRPFRSGMLPLPGSGYFVRAGGHGDGPVPFFDGSGRLRGECGSESADCSRPATGTP